MSTSPELDWKDFRIDAYRKGNGTAGWLNKPDTCVRVTHVPSGIAIEEETDRSLHRNRAEALRKMKLAFALHPEMFTLPVRPKAAVRPKSTRTRWNATLPREAADLGCAHVVLAYKQANGVRMELSGQLEKADAEKLMRMAIKMSKNPEEKS